VSQIAHLPPKVALRRKSAGACFESFGPAWKQKSTEVLIHTLIACEFELAENVLLALTRLRKGRNNAAFFRPQSSVQKTRQFFPNTANGKSPRHLQLAPRLPYMMVVTVLCNITSGFLQARQIGS